MKEGTGGGTGGGSGGGGGVVLTTAPYKHLKGLHSVTTSHNHEIHHHNDHDNHNNDDHSDVPFYNAMKAVAVRSSRYCPFHPQLVVAGGYR